MTSRRGFSLTELLVAILINAVVVIGIGSVLADSQRGWNRIYDRAYASAVTDAHAVRLVFENIVRKASQDSLVIDNAGHSVEVYYYENASSSSIDRYAYLYYDENNSRILLEFGTWNPGDWTAKQQVGTQTVCADVTACTFKTAGSAVQMIVTLDDGSRAYTVTSSALMHNG